MIKPGKPWCKVDARILVRSRRGEPVTLYMVGEVIHDLFTSKRNNFTLISIQPHKPSATPVRNGVQIILKDGVVVRTVYRSVEHAVISEDSYMRIYVSWEVVDVDKEK